MTHSNNDLQSSNKSPATPSTEGAISWAIALEDFNEQSIVLLLRGWYPNPSEVDSLKVSIDGENETTFYEFNEDRNDVLQKEATEGTLRCGFNFKLHLDLAQTKKVTIDLNDYNGAMRSRLSANIQNFAKFSIEEYEYDPKSKALWILGRFLPDFHCRSISISTKSRNFPVEECFRRRPGSTKGTYDYFYTVLHDVSSAELDELSFDFTKVDGKKYQVSLADTKVSSSNVLEIGSLEFDLLKDEFSVTGWFRAYEAFTHLELNLRNQKIHCTPIIEKDLSLYNEFGRCGPCPHRWKVNMRVQDIFEENFDESIEGQYLNVKLLSRDRLLTSAKVKVSGTCIKSDLIHVCIYERDKENLIISGYSLEQAPKTVELHGIGPKESSLISVNVLNDICLKENSRVFNWIVEFPIKSANLTVSELTVLLHFEVEDSDEHKRKNTTITTAMTVLEGREVVSSRQLEIQRSLDQINFVQSVVHRPLLIVFPGSVTAGSGGGNTRQLHMLEHLASMGHNIVLIDRSEPWDIAQRPALYAKIGQLVDFHIPLHPSLAKETTSSIVTELRGLPDATYSNLADELSSAISTGKDGSARCLIKRRTDPIFNCFSALIANLVNPVAYISSFAWTTSHFHMLPDGLYRVLDLHDLQSARYATFVYARHKFVGAPIGEVIDEYYQTENEEVESLNGADCIIAISENDSQALKRLVPNKPSIKIGCAAPLVECRVRSDKNKRLLFVGNNYLPNIHAMTEFITDVFPAILSSHPDAELHVVGSVCNGLAVPLQFSSGKNIFLRGFVDDLANEYHNAAIIVNPVRFGSGGSVKTGEALGFGKPVVCTDFVARGFPGIQSSGAAIIADWDSMSAQISQLLSDDSSLIGLGQRALQYAQNCIGIDRTFSPLSELLAPMVKRDKGQG
ncbi:glycosyltransferase [Maricaulis sp. D1M11]